MRPAVASKGAPVAWSETLLDSGPSMRKCNSVLIHSRGAGLT